MYRAMLRLSLRISRSKVGRWQSSQRLFTADRVLEAQRTDCQDGKVALQLYRDGKEPGSLHTAIKSNNVMTTMKVKADIRTSIMLDLKIIIIMALIA